MSDIAIVGAPSHFGQPLRGVAQGPAVLRKSGLHEVIRAANRRFVDLGDVPLPIGRRSSLELTSTFCERLARPLEAQLRMKRLCLTLGGDHSIAIGSIEASLRVHSDLGVIWLDAHGDINTPETSLTGNVHGMPLAALLGLFRDSLSWMKTMLRPERLALVGVRDLDAAEHATIERLGITVYTAQDVKHLGMQTVAKRVLKQLASAGEPLHFSLDIDALDPIVAPATGCRVNGGLSLVDARCLVRAVSDTRQLKALDLVEINPELARSPFALRQTTRTGLALLTEAIGVENAPTLAGRESILNLRELG